MEFEVVGRRGRLALTLGAGGAFPAVFADAGVGVDSAHTGGSVGTGVGGARAVLSCEGHTQSQRRSAQT